MTRRVRVEIAGCVQGVGFRPTVYRYAHDLGLAGSVANSGGSVVIDVEGPSRRVVRFLDRLRAQPPRQARIEAFRTRDLPPGGAREFRILPSLPADVADLSIPADLATCDECRAELDDPRDRRHAYPFINCTLCGPRFTILEALPYDRPRTTMARFAMCPRCRAEYERPSDRRFHAQPNACPACGPSLMFSDAQGRAAPNQPLAEAIRRLALGEIVAVKGLGGFHLCCDARRDDAVAELRRRKARPHKALAVMFASVEEIRAHCRLSESEEAELASPARPIVILPRRDSSTLSRRVSPDTADVGAFLPYTPLHHLLLAEISPLIMTSANRSEEPIAADRDELAPLVGSVADAVLDHNRPIRRRCDDSVLRLVEGKRLPIRRSRGFVPHPISLPVSGPTVLAVGADLKNAFCITQGSHAYLSQHIGDLSELAACRFHGEAIADWLRLLGATPECVAHDLHPDYVSTRCALGRAAPRRIAVQHHHAHVAACMAEHGLRERVIGVALDGTGYGPDGTIWGGEFLAADLCGFERLARFKPYPMPGGEAAIRRPARMAFACAATELGFDAAPLRDLLPEAERAAIRRMIERGVNTPMTSSAGRLFDAVAALLGLREPITYEGQAAIRLEALAAPGRQTPYPFTIVEDAAPMTADFGPALREIIAEAQQGGNRAGMAARFHNTVAVVVAEVCARIRARTRLHRVALSGGVFQNALLLTLVKQMLSDRGFEVFRPCEAPPNDGGIALGQAAVSLAQLDRGDASMRPEGGAPCA